VRTRSSSRTVLFKTAEHKARVTTAENKDTSPVIAPSRVENVPKAAEDKGEEDTTDVAGADRAEADTSAVAVAALIRELADALRGASLPAPNADRVPETALLARLDGAV
jgi:hypothetical protein